MTLPSSGAISFSAINAELGKASNAQISLNDSIVRTLLAKSSGAIAIADAYGKSNVPSTSFTLISGSYSYYQEFEDLTYYTYGYEKINVIDTVALGTVSPGTVVFSGASVSAIALTTTTNSLSKVLALMFYTDPGYNWLKLFIDGKQYNLTSKGTYPGQDGHNYTSYYVDIGSAANPFQTSGVSHNVIISG